MNVLNENPTGGFRLLVCGAFDEVPDTATAWKLVLIPVEGLALVGSPGQISLEPIDALTVLAGRVSRQPLPCVDERVPVGCQPVPPSNFSLTRDVNNLVLRRL